MGAKINGAEYPLSKIFSSEFEYAIPAYQRPYSWSEEEAGTLFDDLYEFYKYVPEDESYFLRSIVLVKHENKPYSEVIDGQQRLTTLTIFIAELAYLIKELTSLTEDEDEAYYKDCVKYIKEPGSPTQGLEAKPRLSIRPRDNDFFKEYVQFFKFKDLFSLDTKKQTSEAKINIIKNAKILMKKTKQFLPNVEDIKKFELFLFQRCYIVVVSTPTQASAVRVFSVMNSRGMSLLVTDIIKADVIDKIPKNEMQKYTDKWEEMEIQLTRDGFNDLFSQIRMIKMKTKAKKSLLEEFNNYVLGNLSADKAKEFIDKELEPYSQIYRILKECSYESSKDASTINDLLKWLNKIDNSDWLPPAMLFFKNNYNNCDPTIFEVFLRKLERLAAFMRVKSLDVNKRIQRYAKVMEEIDTTNDVTSITSLDLSEDEINDFINFLNSDIYKMTAIKRKYLVLRLDSFVADGSASYNNGIVTIEHVLPQTVKAGSEWEHKWPDPEVKDKWVHKIANLVPLSRYKNSEAQNYDFAEKKEKYFKGSTGTSSYALTTQVLSYFEWTPEVVEKRQKELINVFIKGWNLSSD